MDKNSQGGVKISWTDKKSIEVVKYLRDKYKIKTYIETGTFKGINAKLHSKNFQHVETCEINDDYAMDARKRFGFRCDNIRLNKMNSPDFLKQYKETYLSAERTDNLFIYLDAHFYDPNLPKYKKFVVLDELKSLKGLENCVIMIHDFDNGLGHITYDDQPLNLELIEYELSAIRDFYLYTNTLSGCDIVKPNIRSMQKAGLDIDVETLDNLEYAWSTPRLTFRGILYALPNKLTDNEIKELGLRKL